jgi:hypothetical protein
MAVKKAAGKTQQKSDAEAKVVALAEQLGWFLGTARAKADGWIGNEKVRKELAGIRDGAAKLLQHIDAAARMGPAQPKGKKGPIVAGPKARKVAKAAKPDRGPVDAPGKRHRKPTPNERLDKRMGEPVGKQMGQNADKRRHR